MTTSRPLPPPRGWKAIPWRLPIWSTAWDWAECWVARPDCCCALYWQQAGAFFPKSAPEPISTKE